MRLDSTFARAWFNLGLLYGRSGRTTDTEHAYRMVVASDSLHSRARLNLAVLLAAAPKRRDEARQAYDDLIRLTPGYAAAYYNRGLLELEDGLADAARAHFERAVALDSTIAKAWFNLGRLQARAGDDSRAMLAYRHTVAADSTHVRSPLNLAVSLARLGRLPEAEAAYREILVRDPKHAGAWDNLGITLARLGDDRGAERAYAEVLELHPDDIVFRARRIGTTEIENFLPSGYLSKTVDIESGLFLNVAASHLHFVSFRDADGQVADAVLTGPHPRAELDPAGAPPTQSILGAVLRFLPVGAEHVWTGLDHVAFILALVLLAAGGARREILAATGFTLGHTATLGLAATGVLRPDTVAIEALIGFTIAFGALEAGQEGESRMREWSGPAAVLLARGGLASLFGIVAMSPLVWFGLTIPSL